MQTIIVGNLLGVDGLEGLACFFLSVTIWPCNNTTIVSK